MDKLKGPDLALIIGKKLSDKDKGSPMPEEGMEENVDEGSEKESMEMSAVDDFLSAVHMKDPVGVKQALKDFISICYPDLSPDEESTEEGPTEIGD